MGPAATSLASGRTRIDLSKLTKSCFSVPIFGQKVLTWLFRATSHTRLKARDHYIPSTLVGGKGRAGPSSLHSTLEGPLE